MKNYYFNSVEEFITFKDSKKSLWLLLVAEESLFIYNDFSDALLDCYGAIFPEIIYDKEHYKTGVVAIELEKEPQLIKDIQNPKLDTIELSDSESMLVFVDGLSSHIDSFLFSLFEMIDEDTILFGGGAGKLTFEQERVIFTPEGIYQDAALLIAFDNPTRVGVKHGWEFLEGPLVATSSEKNVLKKIDYEDAFEVYKKIVQEDSGLIFNDNNFFDIAKSYPLGIVTMDNEVIVRDPIFTKDGALILVGIMPENSIINILKGEKKHLLGAANEAAKEAYLESENSELVFMIDCISRVLFLEESFKQEIESVHDIVKDTPIVGALTLGEIANNSKSYIDFYNKTCVVGVICSSNS